MERRIAAKAAQYVSNGTTPAMDSGTMVQAAVNHPLNDEHQRADITHSLSTAQLATRIQCVHPGKSSTR